jgi:hypothetical protein
MGRRKSGNKQIAFRDGTKSVEQKLPFPVVFYPGFYGAFFGFSKTSQSEIFFCSCTRTAISNYIRFRNIDGMCQNADPEKNFILSKAIFPQRFVQQLIAMHIQSNNSIFCQINFQDELCHECNKLTPLYSYCHPMYGGVFEQNYGWYINKQSLEYGVMPVSFKILEDVCPDEVFSSLDIGKYEFFKTYNEMTETELILAQERDSDFHKHTRRIRSVIENEVRVKFGFKKVGEAWTSETMLFQLVSEIFPGEKIIRYYRPDILENLELDVFIPSVKIGLEYQGVQHFKPVKHWGGQTTLKQVRERDKKKKDLANKHGIRLIYFYYTEELTRTLVKRKLDIRC